MGPTLVALTFAGVAHAQGTMDFSGAQTLMTTFKTFAIYAGAVICFGGLIFAGIRMMSGRFQYANPVTASFAKDRIEFLEKTAAFRRIDLHWCLTIEPDTGSLFSQKPKEHKSAADRQLFELEKAATILEAHMSDSIGLKLLDKESVFQFFSYLFNLEEWASDVRLRSDTGVDRQLVHAPVEWHSDHLRIGRRYVQMLALTNTPEISRPCLFTNLVFALRNPCMESR